jgi:hypothetical protein
MSHGAAWAIPRFPVPAPLTLRHPTPLQENPH